ncbi:unnamed protein product [Mytilus coruscus]|uniref:CCHC-type domain-containing protein n=1 Tax=Mytilus coruscus TaxID=42192 RepID=A0A6J8C273_MYTCO|nr:unnamed protein product [Mytilus coruscus]
MKGDHNDYSISSANKIQSNRSSNRPQNFKEDRFQQNGRNMMTNANCSYCGFDHGDERRCPAYGKQCRNCERYNHFASVCRSEKRNKERYDSQQQSRSVNYGNRRNVKKSTEEAYKIDSSTDTLDYEEDEDYFEQTIKHMKKIRRVNNIQGTTDIGKTVTVRIDDVDVKVEPDSGADGNVVDENQFDKFQKRTYGNPVLEKRKINSPPLLSKSTLIELGMLQIRSDGSFVKTNQLRIPDNGPPFNSEKLAIEKGSKHYQVTPGRQIANEEVNVFRKPINKTEQITKLKKKTLKHLNRRCIEDIIQTYMRK